MNAPAELRVRNGMWMCWLKRAPQVNLAIGPAGYHTFTAAFRIALAWLRV